MSKGVLVVGGLVVVAGIVILVLVLGSGGDDTSSASPSPGSAPVAVTPPPIAHSGGAAPTVTATDVSAAEGALPPSDPEHPRDYAVGDTRIRDHRSGTSAPIDVPPNVHPAEGRKIPSTLTHEIAQQVKKVMEQCAAEMPPDARGAAPRLEGQIKIAIKDHKVSVTNALMQTRDLVGDAATSMKQCIEQKTVGLENPAPDQEDLADYDIRLSFAIP